ncbi:MAG: class I SAM-dependent methyltransferase [Rhodospirillaceae bacterium]|jgi:NADH dehydrogenase [ubiquinone] 1 alpha subcomplex assembly factor 7|nr:class I SAM-dependent methyltransferase [Rhodospirillaceae bacterium]MBT5894592.1 class I SAM-dependent methyltransferase [Rhodospirillaceae bacterium]MBT6427148.1 class I SAM-dependent methyltransferase [Rhodospirillaceae bacterium]
MNQLGRYLAEQIRLQGPLSIADYMAAALGHPKWGYYTSRDPFGSSGDFITAPEVSQMFGELIGLWCAERWQTMGAPPRFVLAELGPGRGTLMADALRAAAAMPGFVAAAQVHMVETSPVLRAAQRDALADHSVTWHDRIAELPPGPLLVIANEFFDALPIRQFQRAADGWHERMVAVNGEEFCLVLNPVVTPGEPAADAATGAIAEVSPARSAAMGELAQQISSGGGAGLIIDYGHLRSTAGDTLQAMRAHGYADPMAAPGEADLTAHVDFQALGDAARGCGADTFGPVSQAQFLNALGIATRAEMLQGAATPSQAKDIASALHRLTGRDQMGELFKVMAVAAPGGQAPLGFEDN